MKKTYILLIIICLFSCNSDDSKPVTPKYFKILSLGDSYTFGQAVCETCGYPEQLVDSLSLRFNAVDTFELQVIAQTGWNTRNLKDGIESENPSSDFDLVTLLIGVNNQFQNRPFSWFEEDFPELVNTATQLAKGEKANVIVITIPDYANTGFGQAFGGSEITEELINYNTFIENFCNLNNYSFIDAQDLIFEGLTNPELLAPDNLHPSEFAYSQLVTQLLPLAYEILLE
ncbi:GDSL-type esterase/lipase family protein [Winogradskyella alexanderae]|uniref:GDSL-type esterase/lipase family protein n=1 Tax=Winogradskyella alexanderae TaxID=2877123 RepID=A0ABS7XRA3_9FLAO|nr:GDSL-type esterase/lipase family protein [Winogradskyella alexanderae]MCA0131571.1 GDSL-type esterase/lipase family protein [Winogradskyella alexanderae]